MIISVRVSNELGAGHPRAAAFSVIVVTTTSALIALFFGILVLIFRDSISYMFTDGTIVAKATSELCPYLAASIFLNGIQPVLSGKYIFIFRGTKSFVHYCS